VAVIDKEVNAVEEERVIGDKVENEGNVFYRLN
jgi:hypothetical protein